MNYVFTLIALISITAVSHTTDYGICCVPVADLTVKQLTIAYTDKIPSWYADQFMLGNYKKNTIARISQLLLHDEVIILEETPTAYKIQALDQAYGNAVHTYNSTYYVAKEAIARTTNTQKSTKKVYAMRPMFMPELGITVSAGTKFSLLKTTKHHHLVTALHPTTLKATTCTLDKKICCQPYTGAKNKRLAFVELIRFWARQSPNKIPYVLGGSSIKETFPAEAFSIRPLSSKLFPAHAYARDYQTFPYTGLDCAHLVFLAARMSGVAIKTTNTLGQSKECKLFTHRDTLEAGDLAIWKGHVIIITDVQAGLLAEARGYESGYGIVHEIPLYEQFQNIQTAQDLVNAYVNKTPLTRLTKQGDVEQIITDLRLYKLPV